MYNRWQYNRTYHTIRTTSRSSLGKLKQKWTTMKISR